MQIMVHENNDALHVFSDAIMYSIRIGAHSDSLDLYFNIASCITTYHFKINYIKQIIIETTDNCTIGTAAALLAIILKEYGFEYMILAPNCYQYARKEELKKE